SDAVLDAIYEKDPMARVACETACTTGLVLVMGEITTNCYVDFQKIVRDTVREIGYTRAKYGFDADTCAVISSIDEQSGDIAMGVGNSLETRQSSEDLIDKIGAGDQGMVFGFACNETETYMPMPIYLAHKASKRLSEVRKSGVLPYLRPDGKTQFTIKYEDNTPVAIDSVLISSQHSDKVSQEQLRQDIIEFVAKPIIPEQFRDESIKYLVNPTGRFVLGGPHADSGLTGRKIIVDTYGGYARHGGGAFSGKDPTKVDRSAAYAARYVSKNIVASGAADKCEIQISYAIGKSRPVSVLVDTFGTAHVDPAKIEKCVDELFDLRPAAIIQTLDLRRPIYKQTAAYGHFGRDDIDLPWEKLDRVADVKSYLGL
ncbi:MAG: methionine adenosyltransferase, partial [Clostridia bacterium]|nr:methionine adenosyltransferase [Clostridia bacterium]